MLIYFTLLQVNLPARLVILKNTTQYNMGKTEDMTEAQVLQMVGRAGRPQFDDRGTAVIMTKTQTRCRYESLSKGLALIESSLHKNLIEHLNAEIVLQTITSISEALEWLKSTYLYVRVTKDPKHYGVPTGLSGRQADILQYLHSLCMDSLNKLSKIDLLTLDEDTNLKASGNTNVLFHLIFWFKEGGGG